jgi:hypothetical protein
LNRQLAIQSRWGKYAQWLAIDFLATILVRIPEKDLLLKVYSLLQRIACLEDDLLAGHAISVILDMHFIYLNNQAASYDSLDDQLEEIQGNSTDINSEILNFIARFMLGHSSLEIQNLCLYGKGLIPVLPLLGLIRVILNNLCTSVEVESLASLKKVRLTFDRSR